MLQRRVYLVLEFVAIDGAATSTCTSGISSLKHEIWDYAMEDYVIVVATPGKGSEVPTGLGYDRQFNVSGERTLGGQTHLRCVIVVKL